MVMIFWIYFVPYKGCARWLYFTILLKFNNNNTRRSGVFCINFEHVSQLILVFLLLTLLTLRNAEAYPKPCQTSKVERIGYKIRLRKVPKKIFGGCFSKLLSLWQNFTFTKFISINLIYTKSHCFIQATRG